MAKMLKLFPNDRPIYGRDFNRWGKTMLGIEGGRFKLWGDDGEELDLLTGASVSSNNFPLDIRSDVGYHERIRHSADTHDVWEVLDAGATLEGALGVTGDTVLTGDLNVTGATLLDGAVTLGDAVGDAILVNGASTFKASAVFEVNVTLGDTAGDTITINGTTTANANVTLTGTSVLAIPAGTAGAPSLAVGEATTGLFRQAAGVLGFTTAGTERARLSATGLLLPAGPLSIGATIATAGDIRGTKDFTVKARNAGDDADIQTIFVDGADNIVFGDISNAETVYLSGATAVNLNVGGANKIRVSSTGIGMNGTAPVAKGTITGSRGGNAALASLLAYLANRGDITDNSTA